MQHEEKRIPVREKVTPGIWRRKNAKGRWVSEVTFRDSEDKQRRQVVAGGLREADAELAKIKARMASGQRVSPNPRLDFRQAADAWIEAKSPNLTPKTIQTYRYALDMHLLPKFGRMRLDRIDVTMLAKFIAQMGTAAYRREVQLRNGQTPSAATG